MKQALIVVLLIAGLYSIVQGYYVLKGPPKDFISHAIFSQWSVERKVDWPLGETVIRKVRPTSDAWKEEFPPYDQITVRRFFYEKTKNVYLNQEN